jgi:hypothetical protein
VTRDKRSVATAAVVRDQTVGARTLVRGFGPRELRFAFVGLAVLYYLGLLHHGWVGWVSKSAEFFVDATKLFPDADRVAMEFRLEGWSCTDRSWHLIDPRPYFPMRSDDKESRFQRLAYFYGVRAGKPAPGTPKDKVPERIAMNALDEFIFAHHKDVDDGLAGEIGGIQVYVIKKPIPEPGATIDRYDYQPFVVTEGKRQDLFYTPESKRKARCRGEP